MYVALGRAPGPGDAVWCRNVDPKTCKYNTADRLIAAGLPPCWSQEFDDCIDVYHAGTEQSAFCAKYYDLWKYSTADAWAKAFDQLPFCSEAQIMSPMGYGVIGAAIVAGVMVGIALKKKKG